MKNSAGGKGGMEFDMFGKWVLKIEVVLMKKNPQLASSITKGW